MKLSGVALRIAMTMSGAGAARSTNGNAAPTSAVHESRCRAPCRRDRTPFPSGQPASVASRAGVRLRRDHGRACGHGSGISCSWTSRGQCRRLPGAAARKCRKSQVRMRAWRASAIAITTASARSKPVVSYRSSISSARRCSPSVGRSSAWVPSSRACPNRSAALAYPRAHRTRWTST